MTDDYYEDDDLDKSRSTTSSTLNRLDSLSLIVSNCPSRTDRTSYYKNILTSLIEIICPEFFSDQPESSLQSSFGKSSQSYKDPIRSAACYILSRLIINQIDIFKSLISPILHSSFRPNLRNYSFKPTDESILITSHEISQRIELFKLIVLHSDPSPVLIDRLLIPILPQLISLDLFLRKTKSDPLLRSLIEDLIRIWTKLNQIEVGSEYLRKTIRELEVGRELNLEEDSFDRSSKGMRLKYWSRDEDGSSCIRVKAEVQDDELMILRPDPECFVEFLEDLNSLELIQRLLVKLLKDLEVLKSMTGYMEAKMVLLRMSILLKLIERLDFSKMKDPTQILEFIYHSFIMQTTSTVIPKKTSELEKSLRKDKLKVDEKGFINVEEKLGSLGLEFVKEELKEDVRDEDDEQINDGLIRSSLNLLLTVLEQKLDEILVKKNFLSSESYEVGMKTRLMISVRSAILKVDQIATSSKKTERSEENQELIEREIEDLKRDYQEGLRLIEDSCLPIKAKGINNLKVILLRNFRFGSTKRFLKINRIVTDVIELILKMIEEEDSFVYLNSIKALCELAEKYPGEICDRLNLIYGSLKDHSFDGEKAAKDLEKDNGDDVTEWDKRLIDKKLRVGEAMVLIIQRAGKALPIYI
ncbi:hypothetical protein BY996DRAFT_3419708 [Phakopsora pachyrhizi]|nr:hypothetical protein BY996DRAFT_3419708 [Phakopsora pachyrhizi]